MSALRWKGELADGYVHMTAKEFVDHKTMERDMKNLLYLRKLANNPILSEDAKEAVRYAVFRIDDVIWLRKIIVDLREQIENMKKERTSNEARKFV